MEKNKTYEAAMSELEEIVEKMESGKLNIDELCSELKNAKKLIKMCKDKLSATEKDVKKILVDE